MNIINVLLILTFLGFSSHGFALSCKAGPVGYAIHINSLDIAKSSSLSIEYQMPSGEEGKRYTLSYNIVYSPSKESDLRYPLYEENNKPFISANQSYSGDEIFDDESISKLLQKIKNAYPNAIFWLEYSVAGKRYCSEAVGVASD